MLTLDGLTVSYPAFQLGPLDLTVEQEVLAVLGPSGCGKTTLLAAVAGLTAPSSGRLMLEGEGLDTRPMEARNAALVFQESAVFPHMTARANIAYAAAHPERVQQMAELLEITDVLDQPARTLSGGERRRVEVARALAAEPRVLLLDEPTSGLDTPIKRRLRHQLRAVLARLNIPVLYVTHDQREAAAVADRVAVMHDGQLHQVAPPATLFDRPATPFVARFTGNTNVFPARIRSAHPHLHIEWNGHLVRGGESAVPPGTDVWLCMRPEHLRVVPSDAPCEGNVVPATLRDAVYEGDAYALTLHVAGSREPTPVQARVPSAAYRRLDLTMPAPVQVCVDPAAVHVITRSG